MVKLRHISGSNLKELEKTLEGVKNSIVVVGVNAVGTNWYIHFLMQEVYKDETKTKKEMALTTSELPILKRGK